MLGLLLISSLPDMCAVAAVVGQYVRVENPTAPHMDWQEIEVLGRNVAEGNDEKRNLVRGKPGLLSN